MAKCFSDSIRFTGNDFEDGQDLIDFASTALERKPAHMSAVDYVEMLRRERVPQTSTQPPLRNRSLDTAETGTALLRRVPLLGIEC